MRIYNAHHGLLLSLKRESMPERSDSRPMRLIRSVWDRGMRIAFRVVIDGRDQAQNTHNMCSMRVPRDTMTLKIPEKLFALS